jgi:DNA-binding MarR family transcriptional regulator
MRTLTDEDFRRLRDFRSGLRRFQRWSEERAADEGLTPAQHQLLLTVKGHDEPAGPTIGDVAYHLLVRHHSAVELIDRAEAVGLVRRKDDDTDHRVVRIELTRAGEQKLRALSALHLEELGRLGPRFRSLWSGLEPSTEKQKAPPPRR